MRANYWRPLTAEEAIERAQARITELEALLREKDRQIAELVDRALTDQSEGG